MNTLEKARLAAQEAQQTLYDGVCMVIEYKDTKDGALTRKREKTVLKDIPCRLSFESKSPVNQADNLAPEKAQGTRLFYAPEYTIAPGSKILVTQNGKTTAYSCSGEEAVYFTHKEVEIKLFERWA